MAKGNLILGTARGKLGDTVMYRKDGQQLSRVRVRKISNPKTESQAMQRALLGTLGTAYSYMKGIADHSYQTAQGPLANMKMFMKQNQGKARATGSLDYPSSNAGYNFNPKGEPYLRPNSYVISRGTMPNLPLKELHTGDLSNGFTLDDRFQDLLDVKTTYAAFCARLGVEVGTQLTFCIINDDTFVGPPTAQNKPLPYGNFHYCRIILSDDGGNGDVPMFESSSGDLIINTNYANSKNQGSFKFKRLGETTMALVIQGFQYAIAAACITSNYISGRWLRSNTDFEVSTNVQNSSTMLDVVESYMQIVTAPKSTQYLNQGEGTIVATDEGGTIDAHAFGYMYKGSTNPVQLPRTYEGPWYEVKTDSELTVITSEYPMKNAATIANETTNFVGILARDPGQAVTMIKSFDPNLVPDVGQQLASMQYPCYVYAWKNSSSARFNLLFQAENDVKNVLFNLTIS